MSSERDVRVVVNHEVECRCPVEAFVGKAVDCFDHRACECLANCRRVEVPQYTSGARPDLA